MQKNNLSQNLKRLLKTHQLSTAELARRCHMPQPILHRFVKGTIDNPTIKSLLPIKRYFQCSWDELLEQNISQDSEKGN